MNPTETLSAGNLPPAPLLPPPPPPPPQVGASAFTPPALLLPPPPPPPPPQEPQLPALTLEDSSAIPIPYDDPNGITVLIAIGGSVMTKTWEQTPNGAQCQPFDNAFLFAVKMFRVETPAQLRAVLTAVKQLPSAGVIRGALLPHANPKCTPRRLRDRGADKATFSATTFTTGLAATTALTL